MSNVDTIAERVMTATLDTFDLLAIAIGDRLDYYRTLAVRGWTTSPELATVTDTSERYAREWLEQQAVTGLVEVKDADAPANERKFRLAAGVAEVLAEPDELSYLAPLARSLVSAAAQVPAIVRAARTGGGVPWAAYGKDMRESQADLNRPGFLHLLAEDWLAAMPDVRERLDADPPARVADIGCGGGWSSIAVAQGFPKVIVDAYDIDIATVELARGNVADAGLEDRIRVHHQDIGTVDAEGAFALVTAFECLHDMPYPVQALQAMRRMAAADGSVLIGDMRVAETFTAPGDELERFMYGYSVTVCLPDSLSAEGSAATGTAIRPSIVRTYAEEAGFSSVEELPVAHDMWRFYRLRP